MAEVREITELFRLEKVLKSSPGGVVFRATDPENGQKVAIKLINRGSSPDQDSCRRRFAEAMGALRSLHLSSFPAVRDFGFTPDGTAYVVMELLEGSPVETLVGSPPSRVLGLLGPVVDGLEALAGVGIAHHNLAPDNLMLVHGRTGEQITVLGFGTAAFRPEGPATGRAGRDAAISYLAPELLNQPGAARQADWRSDLYSLNLLVCHLLDARLTPPDFPEVDLPPRAREGLHDVEALRTLLLSGLRHSPEQRPSSYEAVRDAFAAALYGGVEPIRAPEKTEAFRIPAAVQDRVPLPAPALTEPPPSERTMAIPVQPLPSSSSTPAPLQPIPPAILSAPGPAPVLSEPGVGPDDDLSRTMPVQVQPIVAAVPTPPAAMPAAEAASVAPPEEIEYEPAEPEEGVLPLLAEDQGRMEGELAMPIEPGVGGPAPGPVPESIAGEDAGAPEGALEAPVPPLPPPVSSPQVPATTIAFATAQTLAMATGAGPAVTVPPTWPTPPPLPPPLVAPVQDASIASPTASEELPPIPTAAPAPSPEPVWEAQAAVSDGAPEEGVPGEPGGEHAPPPPPPGATKRKGMPLWPLFLVIPLALALVAGGIFFVGPKLVGALLTKPTPTPTPARPTPSPAPRPTQPPRALSYIDDAERLFRAGDFDGAGQALDLVALADEDLLSRDDYDRLRALRDELAAQRAGSLTKDLDRGIRNGNVELLKRTVAAFSPQDLAGVAGDRKVEQQLALARRAIEVQGQLLKASKAQNNAEVIRIAGTLLEMLPKCAQASDLRDRAAATLESEAEALVRGGQMDAAIARLEELRGLWADRPGLDRRIERYRNEVETERKMTALMAEVAQAEQDKKPERGLEVLRGAPTNEKWAARVAEARGRLERLLVELDKGSPSVQLKAGWKPEYEKGKDALIPLKITDDYGVKSVSVRGRVEGTTTYTDIPFRRAGTEYTAEVPSAFHKNEAIELYVTATDASGHAGQLGTAEAPIKVKRKRWLF
jgi:serine/threonine protein kinase